MLVHMSIEEKKELVENSDRRSNNTVDGEENRQKSKANKDEGPGHVGKRSQECGNTPPASSSSQEEEELRDGATAAADNVTVGRICWNC